MAKLINHAIKTVSGSLYKIEEIPRLFRSSKWFIYQGGHKYEIFGLMNDGTKDKIYAKNIRSINEFVGRDIYYSDKKLDDHLMFSRLSLKTSCVKEILVFK